MAKKLGDKKADAKKVVPIENYHAYIATPAYDGKVDVDYAISVAEASFCSPLFQVQISCSMMGNGAFIDLARNIFVKQFIEDETECTHLFFIDSDLKFPANAFIGLIRAGMPICAGVYRRRQDDESYPVRYAKAPSGGLLVEQDSLGLDWIMAERVPTGFLCIRRDVVEEMAKDARQLVIHGQEGTVPELFYTYINDDDRFIGEDFAFCDDYRKKYNKKIHVFPNIDFVHGGFECNLNDYLERQIELESSIKDEDAA
jgi:hypothetical protein